MSDVRFRPAGPGDPDFLLDMLVEAVTGEVTRPEVLADDHLRRYVEAWPRPGDGGLIVVGSDGESLGAVWWRLFPASAPGYGFVAEDVPELSIGLLPGARGRGTGRLLLRAAMSELASGYPRISLSANRSNPARQLYVSEGFRTVGSVGDSDVMVADLLPAPSVTVEE